MIDLLKNIPRKIVVTSESGKYTFVYYVMTKMFVGDVFVRMCLV